MSDVISHATHAEAVIAGCFEAQGFVAMRARRGHLAGAFSCPVPGCPGTVSFRVTHIDQSGRSVRSQGACGGVRCMEWQS